MEVLYDARLKQLKPVAGIIGAYIPKDNEIYLWQFTTKELRVIDKIKPTELLHNNVSYIFCPENVETKDFNPQFYSICVKPKPMLNIDHDDFFCYYGIKNMDRRIPEQITTYLGNCSKQNNALNRKT